MLVQSCNGPSDILILVVEGPPVILLVEVHAVPFLQRPPAAGFADKARPKKKRQSDLAGVLARKMSGPLMFDFLNT